MDNMILQDDVKKTSRYCARKKVSIIIKWVFYAIEIAYAFIFLPWMVYEGLSSDGSFFDESLFLFMAVVMITFSPFLIFIETGRLIYSWINPDKKTLPEKIFCIIGALLVFLSMFLFVFIRFDIDNVLLNMLCVAPPFLPVLWIVSSVVCSKKPRLKTIWKKTYLWIGILATLFYFAALIDIIIH